MMSFKVWPAAILATVFIFTIPSAFAEVETGKDYDRELLSHNSDGTKTYKWTSHHERILDNGIYKDYKLFQDSNIIILETANSGSLVFDKATCSYNLYNSGYVGADNQPKIKGISWTVKGKLASSDTWTAVNSINNAACNASVTSNSKSVQIIGEKSNSVGTFQIVLDYSPGMGIKETMKAYNNNPAWNNHNIGFTEKFEVPKIIHFGNNTYDLANYNQTVLDRNWIENNNAKLIRLSDKIVYDFGIGFDNLNNIKITWDGSKAFLSLNYLYPTQTIPYQTWFEIDPTFNVASGDDGHIDSAAGCGSGATKFLSGNTIAGYETGVCYRAFWQILINSIPDNAIITQINFTQEVTDVSTGPTNNDLKAITSDITSASAATIYSEIGTGKIYLKDTNVFSALGEKTITLTTNATSDMEDQLTTTDRFAIGAKARQEITSVAVDYWQGLSASGGAGTKPFFTVIYVIPVNAPTNLSCEGLPFRIFCSWTASNPASFVTDYFISRSLDNVTFTNVTSTGNVTSFAIQNLNIDKSYYVHVNATYQNLYNSTSSNHVFVTTDSYPTPVQNSQATAMSETWIKINWQPPGDDGGDSITGYRIDHSLNCVTGWSLVINETNTLNYNHTGLSSGQLFCYRMAAWNNVGLSVFTANFTARTIEPTTGIASLTYGVVGDVIQLNTTISITTASPSPVMVDMLQLYRNGTLLETKNVNVQIERGSSTSNFIPFWNQMTTDDNYSFKMYARVSNSTGTVNIGSANTTTPREYDPFYFTAEDPTLGEVNHTESRSDDGDTVYLKVNRDMDGAIFPVSCFYQTLLQALANDGEGTWYNVTSSGYYNATVPVEAIPTIYITCINPPNILFTTTLYSEENPLAAGIALFDAFGGILGAPSIILIVLAIFSLATGKNSPQVLVLALIVIGVLTSIGLIVFEANVFPMILVAGAVGIFAMKKYYF